MIAPVSAATMVSEVTATSQAASASQTPQAALKPDTASISRRGQQMSAGDVDHDGDSH